MSCKSSTAPAAGQAAWLVSWVFEHLLLATTLVGPDDHKKKSCFELKFHLSPVVLLWFVHHSSDRCMSSYKEESVFFKISKLNEMVLF